MCGLCGEGRNRIADSSIARSLFVRLSKDAPVTKLVTALNNMRKKILYNGEHLSLQVRLSGSQGWSLIPSRFSSLRLELSPSNPFPAPMNHLGRKPQGSPAGSRASRMASWRCFSSAFRQISSAAYQAPCTPHWHQHPAGLTHASLGCPPTPPGSSLWLLMMPSYAGQGLRSLRVPENSQNSRSSCRCARA